MAKMKTLKTEEKNKNTEKLSYEQLENIAHQLSDQVRSLMTQLKERNVEGVYKRMDYLFQIVNLSSNNIFPNEFVESCAQEIIDLMSLSTEEELAEEGPEESK